MICGSNVEKSIEISTQMIVFLFLASFDVKSQISPMCFACNKKLWLKGYVVLVTVNIWVVASLVLIFSEECLKNG